MRGVAAIIVLLGGAAHACEPGKASGPYGQRVALENCAARIQHDPLSAASLSEAEDLGNGFVVQELADGRQCEGEEVNWVVQDCSSGRVVVFGEFQQALGLIPTDEKGFLVPLESLVLAELVKSKASTGHPMSLDDILESARSRNIQFVLESTTKNSLAINGHAFPIKCGCRTFYPGS